MMDSMEKLRAWDKIAARREMGEIEGGKPCFAMDVNSSSISVTDTSVNESDIRFIVSIFGVIDVVICGMTSVAVGPLEYGSGGVFCV